MQIVINIPQGRYEDILSGKEFRVYQCDIREVLKNGTPLPKGHGRLIDADKYRKDMQNSREFNFFATLDFQQTIIEADKPASGCSSCSHSGSIIDGYKDCPNAYTEQSQYCGLNNKEE